MGHNFFKKGQRKWAAALHLSKALYHILRSLGNCCIGSTVSSKTYPEKGDAAELVPLTLHGILDGFDSAAGLCPEEKPFTSEKGVPVRVLQIQTQHFSAVGRFVYFHTHILSRSFFILLLTADKKFASHK